MRYDEYDRSDVPVKRALDGVIDERERRRFFLVPFSIGLVFVLGAVLLFTDLPVWIPLWTLLGSSVGLTALNEYLLRYDRKARAHIFGPRAK